MTWDDLDSSNISDEEKNYEEQVTRERQVLSAVFNTDAGKEALHILQKWTVDRPCFPSPETCADGVVVSQLMCIREGENNLFRRVKACVAKPDIQDKG